MDRLAYTVDEAKATLGVSLDMIYDLMREGKLRYVQPTSRKRLIPADAISEFLNGQEVGA
jgi:excisionase family DNA binding protein